MNTQMYDLVKNAIKDGSSIEDIVAEVNALAKTVQEEMKPHAPLLEKYCVHAPFYQVKADASGRVDRESLISAVATYFVQHGFNPDPYFEDEDEFRGHIAGIIDRGLSASKGAADLAQMEMEGASEEEMLAEMFKHIGAMASDALKGFLR